MDKNIKDYLHFYLGCMCEGSPIKAKSFHAQLQQIDVNGYCILADMSLTRHLSSAFVKPILRPFTDITDEEIDEVWNGHEPKHVLKMEYSDGRNVRQVALCSERTRYFLSRGFDLFGLIEAGLALDKTKI
jgi:hypothetical protein